MEKAYKIVQIDGKGLGWIATRDIERGSLIANENAQIYADHDPMSVKWIKSLVESFEQMNRVNQNEYLSLHDKHKNVELYQSSREIQSCKKDVDLKMNALKTQIATFEQDPEKAEKILKICFIYLANANDRGVRINASRVNHSCQPNANSIFNWPDGPYQVRAIANIKAGEEICFNFIIGNDPFHGFRSKQQRQKAILHYLICLCACDLCKNENGPDAYGFETLIKEAEELTLIRKVAFSSDISPARKTWLYSEQCCQEEINIYKKMYKDGKAKKIQPYFLWTLAERAYDAAKFGYFLHELPAFKSQAERFAKTSEEYEKIFGEIVVNHGYPNWCRERSQDVENSPYTGTHLNSFE